jgi:putative membrane protein
LLGKPGSRMGECFLIGFCNKQANAEPIEGRVVVAGSLTNFPNFVAYFVGAGVLTALFLALYARITEHRELALIRHGNIAAAIALSGGLLGFVIPLASVIAHSASLIDLVVWGVIAMVVQLGGFVVARLLLPHLREAVAEGKVADAVFLAGLSVSLGILAAACMAG